jgi:hypothetical protein
MWVFRLKTNKNIMTQNKNSSGVPWGKTHYTDTQRKVMFQLHKLGFDMVELHFHQEEIVNILANIDTQNENEIKEIANSVKTYLELGKKAHQRKFQTTFKSDNIIAIA